MTISRKAIGNFSIVAILVLITLAAFTPATSAADVNPGGSIQAAINVATPGEIITVHDGTYKENLIVNKSNITIRSANGSAVTIISSNQTEMHVVNITDQTNVTLDGFTIRDARNTLGGGYVAGITMENASECNISKTIVTNISATNYNSAYGIYLGYSSNNTFNASTSVSNVTAVGDAYGIYLGYSSNNTFNASTSVSTVTATDGSAYGIWLYASSNNTFNSSTSVSTITAGDDAYGISLEASSNNRFSSSTSVSTVTAILDKAYGIYLWQSSNNNTFSANTSVSNVTATYVVGISLYESSNNTFSSSTAVSNVTATNGIAYGIYLYHSSNNNTFSASTSVSTIKGEEAYGISLDDSSDNTFSASTSISNVTATNGIGYGTASGIHIDSSDDNSFTGVTITPTITGSEYYEFWSDEGCDGNVVTDMTIGNPATISFTYGNGIWIKRVNVSERPADPANFRNISKYINASNVTPNSWLFVNFSYSESDVAFVDETTLSVWRYNGTAWNEEWWNGSRVLDTVNNVVGVNITDFSIFAPLGTPVTSVTIPTATGSGDATINTSSGYFCSETNALPASPPDPPALTFTHGFFNFTICGLNDISPETVTINFTFPSAIPTDAEFWKYNASNGTWYRYPFGDNDGDNVISITITDNGPGDHNPGLGIITDPNGIGWRQPAVAPVPVPAMTPIGLVALVGLLSALAAVAIVRKRH